MIRKTPAWIALLLLVTCGGFVQIESKACEESPGKPAISVSGAQAGSDPNYYVVEIPAQGTTTVTITGSGQTPCPTDAEKCTCQYNSDKATQDTDGDSKFTFVKPLGTQDPNDGPNVKIDITSSTAPNEYKFKVSKIEQMYKPCSNGWTGGVTSKSNNQSSDEVTVCVVKFELDDIDITGGGLVMPNNYPVESGKFNLQMSPSSAQRSFSHHQLNATWLVRCGYV